MSKPHALPCPHHAHIATSVHDTAQKRPTGVKQMVMAGRSLSEVADVIPSGDPADVGPISLRRDGSCRSGMASLVQYRHKKSARVWTCRAIHPFPSGPSRPSCPPTEATNAGPPRILLPFCCGRSVGRLHLMRSVDLNRTSIHIIMIPCSCYCCYCSYCWVAYLLLDIVAVS